MIYAIDTEFVDNGNTIDLIRIGVVVEDGRELYLQNLEANLAAANPWVKEHVIPHLAHPHCWKRFNRACMQPDLGPCPWRTKEELREALREFITPSYLKPQIMGYYADYDWVALNQLYGPLIEHPEHWPWYCLDLRQWLDEHGHHDVKQPDDAPHQALSDAHWIMETYKHVPCACTIGGKCVSSSAD